jgi:uncharacterized membrane protein HdeD (DUF308 family)
VNAAVPRKIARGLVVGVLIPLCIGSSLDDSDGVGWAWARGAGVLAFIAGLAWAFEPEKGSDEAA